ncbi:helix-turn-helix domain-containing protein [Streptomyces sp. NPDC001530]
MCEEYGDVCRAVWNTALERRRQYRRRGGWTTTPRSVPSRRRPSVSTRG